MPVSLNGDDALYSHFNNGVDSKVSPLTSRDKDMVNFLSQNFKSTAERDKAIQTAFGLSSVDYFRRIEALKDHPYLSKQVHSKVGELFSTPGPMTGGAPIMGSKQFSHGVNW